MRWHYETIAYEAIDKERVESNETLFFLVSIASFIEITSDVYERNLARFYEGDEEVVTWLERVWEPEELQHGKALRRYVQQVWEGFDWQSGYERFLELYLPFCTLDEFQPTRAGEMLARMVVETGTSTFYKALERFAIDLDEPVLAQIAYNISLDEVRHYSRFYEAFKRYNEKENLGRGELLKVIYRRLKMAESEDTKLAFRAIKESRNEPYIEEEFEKYKQEISQMAKRYYPYKMAIRMLLQPLGLNEMVERASIPIIRGALRIVGV